MNQSQVELYNHVKALSKGGSYDEFVDYMVREIGLVMVRDKKSLIKTIKDAGGDVKADVSDKELAKMISFGLLNQQKKFIENLVSLLYKTKETYANDDSTQLTDAGLTALGGAVAKGLYGKDTARAKEQRTAIQKTEKVWGMVKKIIADREKAKAMGILASSESLVEQQESESNKKVFFIVGASILALLVIVAIYKKQANAGS
jgi:hypothetical protein